MMQFLRRLAQAWLAILSFSLGVPIVGVVLAAPNTAPSDAPAASQGVPDTLEGGVARSPREQIIAERLKLARVGDEIRWIESESENFLALWRDSYELPAHGGIIINISAGAIVDARPVHQTLARAAAAGGWVTLSLQPRFGKLEPLDDPSVKRLDARLDAGFKHMVSNGIQNIIVVGDAGGAKEALNYIVKKASPAISGFVGLGAWEANLDGTDIAILDIAGTRDHRALSNQAKRTEKYRRRKKSIEKLEIDGAGPGFYGFEDQIAKRIRGWLERATPGVALHQL